MANEDLRILAFEDDPSDAVLLRRYVSMIEDWNIDLQICETAAAGLSELSRTDVDVVLLDYQLGGENGLTVLSAIRAARRECPVVFLTGQGDEQLAVRALQAGATDYLPKKALSANSLTRSLINAVEKGRLQRLLQEHREGIERANANLERRNREIEGFYHTVSHELRTPLTSAREFVRIILDGLAGEIDDQQREYLEIVEQSCDQMSGSIDDLLDASRLETGKLSLQLEPREIEGLVSQIVQSMRPVAGRNEIELRCEIQPDLPPVHVDPRRVSQVLRNLLSNAIKFSPAGEVVVVRARPAPDDEAVSISVADRGCGIVEEHRERIFDRAYQVRSEDYSTKGGLGLGLSICQQLVELHEGNISVASEPGAGTTFTFTLPCATAAEDLATNRFEVAAR